ncbi:MAG: hypothetical protein AUK55_00890 [Syntrophobacteraceae bacterium CG2_30_61_12]|nr:MAG: hypothetical protein AUK55_00890 [Syntrophobacteraceae bacterium CG2_30_61_12]
MPTSAEHSTRNLGKQLESLLLRPDFGARLDQLNRYPARKVVNPLFALLCHSDEMLRWRAISAFGQVVSQLAEQDLESARVIMRRLMWSLNDESGGIGWGAPEAMGEIMARSEQLAVEFSHILVSFIWEDGNYLEHPLLQRGVLWGLGRLAETRPQLLGDAPQYLLPFLDATDPALRGLAVLVLTRLGAALPPEVRRRLQDDPATIRIYRDFQIQDYPVSNLVAD